MESVHDMLSSTSREDCLVRIESHLERLFGEMMPALRVRERQELVETPRRADERRENGTEERVVPLLARGKSVGEIVLTNPVSLSDATKARLATFADHAALALDNARMLEDHDRRARRDPLTGLLNRAEFQDLLATEVARAARPGGAALSLAVFDLDRFKSVNDLFGHGAGDRLLRSAAAAMTAACRSSDAAFRIGGDEFALLLPNCNREEAAAIAERAAESINRLDGSAGASWGVATIPTDATNREGLVAAADAAMYEHKGHRSETTSLLRRDANGRLEVASSLAMRLTTLQSPFEIARAVVDELNSAFGYYLAVINRLDDDGMLRIEAAAGRLTEDGVSYLVSEQPISCGVNGRVARTGRPALVDDTRLDPDYITVAPSVDPGSELSLPIMVDGSVWGVLNLEQMATHSFDEYDVMLAEAVVAQTGAALHRCKLIDEMEMSFSTTLGALCDALETKDAYTASHAEVVAELALATADALELDAAQRRALRYCALLHDIGKIGIRTELLLKPGGLTGEEYLEIQRHAEIGANLLARIPLLEQVAPLVRAVHERWDGSGYPDRLAGTRIPIASRIVAICDAWHAMRSDRPYRGALSQEQAVAELTRCSGTQFDPAVVRGFLTTIDA
jgi:diguanylate cyclase (GGDEF)-like protein/putative nucleotidyltransferase with HDIG domain